MVAASKKFFQVSLLSFGMVTSMFACDKSKLGDGFQQSTGQDGKTIDDRTDEARPPFVDVPKGTPAATLPVEPAPGPGLPGPAPGVPVPAPVPGVPVPGVPSPAPGPGTGGGTFGVAGSATCDEYIKKFWAVGAKTFEQMDYILGMKITFTSQVLSVSGSNVTLRTVLNTPKASANLDETITFDACTEGHKSAAPSSAAACPVSVLGNENVTVNGKTYSAVKTQIGMCTTTKGDTFQTLVWRVPELPLWGVIKREVTGTIVPSEVSGGKLTPTTRTWNF